MEKKKPTTAKKTGARATKTTSKPSIMPDQGNNNIQNVRQSASLRQALTFSFTVCNQTLLRWQGSSRQQKQEQGRKAVRR